MVPDVKSSSLVESLLLLGNLRARDSIGLAHFLVLLIEDGVLDSVLDLLVRLSVPGHGQEVEDGEIYGVTLNLMALLLLLLEGLESGSVVTHAHGPGLVGTLPLFEVCLEGVVVIFVLRKLSDQGVGLAGRMGIKPEIGEYLLQHRERKICHLRVAMVHPWAGHVLVKAFAHGLDGVGFTDVG
jgi:hypothetical protein